MTALVWLRRDLRVHDHPALAAALAEHERVVPVFCLDRRLLHGLHASGPRARFLLECLADLRESLAERGGGLVVRWGPPESVVPALAREVGAAQVYWTDDVGPFARRRDGAVREALSLGGVGTAVLPGMFAVDDPAGVRTGAGGPFTVFTPFHRAWLRSVRREVVEAPGWLSGLPRGLDPGALPSPEELGVEAVGGEAARGVVGGGVLGGEATRGGERAGRAAMERFVGGGVAGYDAARDDLGADASSRLSPYLHLGCVSARELEASLGGVSDGRSDGESQGAEAFRRQLCWRDFYAHVLAHFPGNARSEFQARYRGGRLRWSRSRRLYEAWCDGCTGYPLVDAGMRQLRREGWMHNRARLVVGSFLTKDLGIDWRWGERWFMRMLIDGDEASNNGNWQWIASVGVDPQPAFRRMYNPARQQARFDPDGSFVRRYVPELRAVPAEYLAEPWTMPLDVQRSAGCVIGEDYPRPIVDHAVARREALARYGEAAQSGRGA